MLSKTIQKNVAINRLFVLLLLPFVLLVGCSTQDTQKPVPEEDRNTVVEDATSTATPISFLPGPTQSYLISTVPLISRINEAENRAMEAIARFAEESDTIWADDPSLTQREAIQIPRSKPTVLGNMTEEEIKKALSTRAKPYIPPSLELAIVNAITTLDSTVAEIELASSDLQNLESPTGAEAWRSAQLQYLNLLRQSYLWVAVAQSRLLELGVIPDEDANRMLDALEKAALSRELADREFSILYAISVQE